jgi:hypothetical protein
MRRTDEDKMKLGKDGKFWLVQFYKPDGTPYTPYLRTRYQDLYNDFDLINHGKSGKITEYEAVPLREIPKEEMLAKRMSKYL